ncbi:peptidoglycan recognition protein [Streptomyces sp. NPDC059070]|uniref:peptidoglycan recognition protein family protein n=1 Tax=unclassified Streptomyces TaxID=2593676 RepID=UPI0034E25E39
MRALLASSIGVACAAALALPLAVPAEAAAPATTSAPAAAALPGSTQSLPLAPLGATDRTLGAARPQGLPERDTKPFSLLGVVWDDARSELHGTVQVRTRAVGSRAWTGWQDIDTHNQEHAPDPGSAEDDRARTHGSTAPLWVGSSDGVEVRVRPEAPGADGGRAAGLPRGLHIDLVDPGADPDEAAAGVDLRDPDERAVAPAGPAAGATGRAAAAPGARAAETAERAAVAAGLELPALSRTATEAEGFFGPASARPYIGPRPRIITRRGWGADERLREPGYVYTGRVKAAFVHHTASGNNYRCSQAASVLRSIYRYHVRSSGWRDIGYNFAVDKCGNIYEGRAGGVAKPVLGAHTLGFNTNSMGVAVLGTYTSTNPSAAALDAIAKLTAWKLGMYGVNPKGTTHLTSGGGNLYRKGRSVRLNVISGHRDGFATECPGTRLYKKLGKARTSSAHLQGRG